MTESTLYRWHVGTNVPGYSPESEPGCFATADEARDALHDELERTRDHVIEGLCDHSALTNGCEYCALWATANGHMVDLGSDTVDVTEGYSFNVDIGRALPITHWVSRHGVTEFDNHTNCNPDA